MNLEDQNITREELIRLFTGGISYRQMMRLYLDEGVDRRVFKMLRSLDVAAATVQAQGKAGEKSDFRILAHARQLGCTFVTPDNHFEEIHEYLMEIGRTDHISHAGIITITSDWAKDSPYMLARALARLVEKHEGFADFFTNRIYPV